MFTLGELFLICGPEPTGGPQIITQWVAEAVVLTNGYIIIIILLFLL